MRLLGFIQMVFCFVVDGKGFVAKRRDEPPTSGDSEEFDLNQ
jgi:hypothetical protein